MSFFFDVWTDEGFVLASDVSLLVNETQDYEHKIEPSALNSKVTCAIAVCGEYPRGCINYFVEACSRKDTLKEIAKDFATKWTKRYGGTKEYSAVHLVGFEKIPSLDAFLPQMWYWHNSIDGINFKEKEKLEEHLSTFSDPIPFNDHMPRLVSKITGKMLVTSQKEEYSLVKSFLHLYHPYFTWNGDTRFWKSAADLVGSAMNLLRSNKIMWTVNETAELTSTCLRFLAEIGIHLTESTVRLSPEDNFDVLMVTPENTEWHKRAELE